MGAFRATPVKAAHAPPFRGGVARRVCFFAIPLLLSVSAAASRAEFARVGYINSTIDPLTWTDYPQLFNKKYTHIITAFLIPDATGAITVTDAALDFGAPLIGVAQAAGSKVLVSIGGSTVSYKVYIDIAANQVAKDNFIGNVVTFVTGNGYDGVDADFEGQWFPDVGAITVGQRNSVDQLILDLAQALKIAHFDATFTVTLATLYFLPVSPSAAVVNSDLIDMAHHMSYDFMSDASQPNGPFRSPGSTQWLYWSEGPVEKSVWGAFHYLYSKGYDLSKVTGGVPFYATDYASWNSVRADADWPSIGLDSDYLEKQHPDDGRWVNDPEAIAAKTEEYKNIGLAGVMVWQVGEEAVPPAGGDLSAALYGAATRPDPLLLPLTLNFQPPLAECYDTYKRDSGAAYGLRGDYGWLAN